MRKKLLVIGIDGATFDVIKPMVKEGKLPTIAKLMKEGIYSELFSTYPSVTCTAWPSLTTGKNPGKHGIIDWHYYRKDYTEHFYNGADIRGKRFWDYLSDRKIKCFIINVPITYPPYKINGIMISGFPSVGEKVQFTYPEELKEELMKDNYEIDSVNRQEISDRDFFRQIIHLEEKRKNVSIKLMKNKKWDMFFVVFRPEPLQNRFWVTNMKAIEKVYEITDRQISELIECAGENTDIIVLSDHGFGRTPKYNFYLNRWLADNRYMKMIGKKNKKLPIDKMYRILVKLGLGRLKYLAGKKIRSMRFINYSKDVEWERSACFGRCSEETGFIYLNKTGRFDRGIVNKENVEKIKNEIKNKLINLKYKGLKVIEKIWDGKETYHGLEIAPDLIFKINGEFRGLEVYENEQFVEIPKKDRKSWHEFEGIFIAAGPSIKKIGEIEQKKIVDIAPTILDFYKIKTPKDMDGRTIKIFK